MISKEMPNHHLPASVQVNHAILNSIKQGYKEQKLLSSSVHAVLSRTMGQAYLPPENYITQMISKLSAEDYLVKENIETEGAVLYSLTARGEELLNNLVKQICDHSVYVLTKGVQMPLGIVEEIFKCYEVVMAAVPEKIRMPSTVIDGLGEVEEKSFFNIVFSLNVADKEKRIALRFPMAQDRHQLYLVESNYDYNVFNAFATFMTLNGVQVFYAEQEKDPAMVEEGHFFKLSEYDPHNPPDKFDLIRNEDLSVLLGISKAQSKRT